MIADLAAPDCPTLSPEDIVRAVRHLPAAPKVLPRLKQLLLDGNTAMHEIVTLLRFDPGIAARVLQTANSTAFSQGVRCTTVEQAVNRVGYDRIYELVAHAVASQVLIRPLEIYAIDADDLWKMSVAGALAAEALAVQTRQDCNDAYTIGLLHCVGMVALDEWALRTGEKLSFAMAGFPQDAAEAERARFGFTQAQVGSALLRHWDFSAETSEPVLWQYAPLSATHEVRMASLLHAAKWVRTTVCTRDPNERPALPGAALLARLGVTGATMKGIAADVRRRLAAVSFLLDSGEPQNEVRNLFPARHWQG
jgi:HD-like signal output (HDOD) protein